jgi:AAA domain
LNGLENGWQPREAVEPEQTESPGIPFARASVVQRGPTGTAFIIGLDTVAPEPIEWLWPAHIALGKLSVLEGDPDQGKSTVLLDIAARVSRGDVMPGGTPGLSDAAGVLLLATAEDGLADTIVPRLIAAGADLGRVKSLAGITMPDGTRRPFEVPRDLPELQRMISEHGVCLVVIDALMAVLPGDVNSYRDQDVRRALHPLAELAEHTGAAVVFNRHFTKATGQRAIHKGGGSVAISGVVRAQMLVMRDPDDEDRRLLAMGKNNLVPDDQQATLSYTIESAPVTIPATGAVIHVGKVVWGESDPRTAEELVRQSDRAMGGESKVGDAAAFLAEMLGPGWRWSDALKAEWEDRGGREHTLRRAFKDGRCVHKRVGFGAGAQYAWGPLGYDGPWPVNTSDEEPPLRDQAPVAAYGDGEVGRAWETPDGDSDLATTQLSMHTIRAQTQMVVAHEERTPLCAVVSPRQSRPTCKQCREPWTGLGTVCHLCLDGGA